MIYRPSHAFTLMEVMVATMILAIGITAALDAILTNNNLRRSLDETAMADLVLRQMSARLKSANLTDLGHVYAGPSSTAQSWTLHLRATASTTVPAASTSATALPTSYAAASALAGPFRPLTQADLITADILRENMPLDDLSLFVEYYNLNTVSGLQNVAGSLVPVESGLIRRFNDVQENNPTAAPRQLWYSLVGDPDITRRSPAVALSPTDAEADAIIMPSTFSLANVDQPGTPEQIRGAFNHGLVIRILVSWRPGGISSGDSALRSWRETVIVKRD